MPWTLGKSWPAKVLGGGFAPLPKPPPRNRIAPAEPALEQQLLPGFSDGTIRRRPRRPLRDLTQESELRQRTADRPARRSLRFRSENRAATPRFSGPQVLSRSP